MIKRNPFTMTKEERVVFFTKMSVPVNVLLAIGKALLSLFTLSFFLFINALYSLGIGLAKFVPLNTQLEAGKKTLSASQLRDKKNRAYKLTGVVIAVSAIVYFVYCIKMFVFKEGNTSYGLIPGIAIAAFTFGELALASVGAKTMRRRHEPLLEAIKMTNLASALISIVLTQTALLSLSEGDHSFYNGLCGIIFGSLAACVGIFMIIRMRLIEKGKYAESKLKTLRKKLSEENLSESVFLLGCADVKALPLVIYVRTEDKNGESFLKKFSERHAVSFVCEQNREPASS